MEVLGCDDRKSFDGSIGEFLMGPKGALFGGRQARSCICYSLLRTREEFGRAYYEVLRRKDGSTQAQLLSGTIFSSQAMQ